MLAFAQGQQQTLDPERIEARLSLVVRKAGQVIGTIVCVSESSGGCRWHLLLAADCRENEPLIRHLVDKALLKARSDGFCRARIEPDPAMDEPTFWSAMNWQRHVERVAAGDADTLEPEEVGESAAAAEPASAA